MPTDVVDHLTPFTIASVLACIPLLFWVIYGKTEPKKKQVVFMYYLIGVFLAIGFILLWEHY
jgi:hypothetical protein